MSDRRPAPLREGIDYYREGSFNVLTEDYLRSRGYCCESGCRHCPWGYRRDGRADVPGDSEAASPEEP